MRSCMKIFPEMPLPNRLVHEGSAPMRVRLIGVRPIGARPMRGRQEGSAKTQLSWVRNYMVRQLVQASSTCLTVRAPIIESIMTKIHSMILFKILFIVMATPLREGTRLKFKHIHMTICQFDFLFFEPSGLLSP